MTPLKRRLLIGAVAVVGVLGLALVADVLVPPATASSPLTLYVDRRIGADSNDGLTPENALFSFAAALKLARPGADIVLTGYGSRLSYDGTGTKCVTLRGTPDKPITIRRNVYTNTLYPAKITSTRLVKWRKWTVVSTEGSMQVWAANWPSPIRLSTDPDAGFVKLGVVSLTGYAKEPPASAGRAAWWADNKLYVRMENVDPNKHPVYVKDGDGLCLTGESRHVRISDLMFAGAVHAIRVEPGAEDIQVRHIHRQSVLDKDMGVESVE